MTQPILLATGENRLLTPLTDEMSPAMLPVGHQPVMAHVVELLGAQGLRHLLVSLHYQAASIESYFGQGERWGVNLEYVVQRDPLGTAGALKWASRKLTETILVIPADRLVDIDLQAALNQHRQQGNAASVLVPAPSFQGPIKAPNGLREPIGERHALPPGEVPSSLGIYIFEPAVLDLIPPLTPYDIHSQLLPAMLQAGLPVGAVATPGYWNRLGSFQDYSVAQNVFMSRLDSQAGSAGEHYFPNVASVRGRYVGQHIWVGRNNAIDPTARLAGPVFIGANCRVGRNVELGPNVVLGANVIVDDEATLSNTVVLDNTYVGKLVKLDQRVARKDLLIDVTTASHVHVADAFWLSETHTSVDQSVVRRVWDQLLGLLMGACMLPLAAIWALALWLTTGHIFTRKTYLRPARRAGANPVAETRTVLNFYSANTNRLAAWLSRWQVRLEWQRLPELLSVISGQIRLVGVKPLTPEEAAQATETWQQAQREFEPGLTGLWYIQTDQNSDLDSVLIADVYYGATRNWRNDMAILWQTPAAWFRRIRRAGVPGAVSGSQTEVPLWS